MATTKAVTHVASGPDDAARDVTPRQANVGLAVVMLVAIVNIVDRNIIIILQEPIKRDLGLSDSQLGLLTGLAFALVYTLCSFPLARLADRWVRKHVILMSLVVWSSLTALTSLAASFPALVLCRMGVALGESGSTPASHSLISDYFPPDRRVIAFAMWSLSVPIGTMIGYGLGGWLNDSVGWRNTMMLIGVGGLLLSPLLLLLVREPRRGRYDDAAPAAAPSIGAVAQALAGNVALRRLLYASGAQGFVLFGVLSWSAPFYIRSHEMSLGEIAASLSLVIGVAGGIGVMVGAAAARRLGKADGRWYMWIPAIGNLLFVPLLAVQLLVADRFVSLAAGAVAIALAHLFISIIVAQAHALVVPTMRATASATLGFAVGMFGVGLGPLFVGVASDIFAGQGFGTESLRYAILLLAPLALLAATLFLRVAVLLPAGGFSMAR